jgi:hypothetical protein
MPSPPARSCHACSQPSSLALAARLARPRTHAGPEISAQTSEPDESIEVPDIEVPANDDEARAPVRPRRSPRRTALRPPRSTASPPPSTRSATNPEGAAGPSSRAPSSRAPPTSQLRLALALALLNTGAYDEAEAVLSEKPAKGKAHERPRPHARPAPPAARRRQGRRGPPRRPHRRRPGRPRRPRRPHRPARPSPAAADAAARPHQPHVRRLRPGQGDQHRRPRRRRPAALARGTTGAFQDANMVLGDAEKLPAPTTGPEPQFIVQDRVLLLRGAIFREKYAASEAADTYDIILKRDPWQPDALAGLALVHLEQFRLAAASRVRRGRPADQPAPPRGPRRARPRRPRRGPPRRGRRPRPLAGPQGQPAPPRRPRRGRRRRPLRRRRAGLRQGPRRGPRLRADRLLPRARRRPRVDAPLRADRGRPRRGRQARPRRPLPAVRPRPQPPAPRQGDRGPRRPRQAPGSATASTSAPATPSTSTTSASTPLHRRQRRRPPPAPPQRGRRASSRPTTSPLIEAPARPSTSATACTPARCASRCSPTPNDFSVRTIGVPSLGAVGVCFGDLITSVGPYAGTHNFHQVLWHELAHVYAVKLSKGRVPRWFTEGLSEWESELADPSWARESAELLAEARRAGRMRKLGELDLAFLRATSPDHDGGRLRDRRLVDALPRRDLRPPQAHAKSSRATRPARPPRPSSSSTSARRCPRSRPSSTSG